MVVLPPDLAPTSREAQPPTSSTPANSEHSPYTHAPSASGAHHFHTLQPQPRTPQDSISFVNGSGQPAQATSAQSAREAAHRMRSSIACIRCRRSKVKCVNDGVGTPCRSCQNANRECQYPSPMAVAPRRDGAAGKAASYDTGEVRPRPRKRAHTATDSNGLGTSREIHGPLGDALDPRLLTPTVWQELFDIFQIHYSADLPFLHPPTFLKPLRQAKMQQTSVPGTPGEGIPTAKPPMSAEFLLAFLALTARFHPKLVAHHSPPTSTHQSNPLTASDYYATAARERLSGIWNHDNIVQDIERTQAMLMLGLHEWGMCRGARAWITVGVAIRSAQVMGLQYEMELDDEPLSRSLALDLEAESMGVNSQPRGSVSDVKYEGDAFIHQEIRRRTFWSCYIMDRYLSSGKFRPQMLHAKEMRIQLPASERSFLFGEKVRTLMLCEDEDGVPGRAEVQSLRRASVMLTSISLPEPTEEPSPKTSVQETEENKGRLEVGEDEGLLSRYIKILEIYGRVIKWSCAGGRRIEQHPPWDRRTEFYQLRRQCLDFKASLPRQHTLTPQNTQAHITQHTSTPYILLHTVYLLCQIMLHREYVPFIPLRCSKPEGPLDPPLFSPDKFDVPPGFWDESARECFKPAREIIDLVRSCQEWSALVETPIVGFAVYNVAFAGVYAINFPWMDTGSHLSTRVSATDPKKIEDRSGFEAVSKALEMIGQMRTKVKMADGWFRTINRMYQYFRQLKRDYKRNTAAMENSSESESSPISTRHLSLREGGIGGGLDEFRLLERTLHDFGNLEDQIDAADTGQRPTSKQFDTIHDDTHSHSGTTVKSEEAETRAGAPAQRASSGPWNAINAVPENSSRTGSASTSSNGPFRTYDYYEQQQQQQPPSQPQSEHPNEPPPQAPTTRPFGFVQEGANGSLASPLSRTVSTPSHTSPGFDHRQAQQQPVGWFQHQTSYSMPAHQSSFSEGYPYPQQQATPIQGAGAYPAPGHHPQHHLHDPNAMQGIHHPWNEVEREAWLNSLPTEFGGDDYAAFADGADFGDYAMRGYVGWMGHVWEGAAATH